MLSYNFRFLNLLLHLLTYDFQLLDLTCSCSATTSGYTISYYFRWLNCHAPAQSQLPVTELIIVCCSLGTVSVYSNHNICLSVKISNCYSCSATTSGCWTHWAGTSGTPTSTRRAGALSTRLTGSSSSSSFRAGQVVQQMNTCSPAEEQL